MCAAAGALALPAAAQTVPPPPSTLPNPLTLDQAIAIAMAHQPSRFIASTQITSASGAVEQAHSEYFPQITPSYTWTDNSNPTYQLAQPNGGTTEVNADETVFDNGKRENINAQARRQLEEARYNDRDVKQQVIDTVTRDYYSLLEAIDLVKVADSQVKSSQTEVDEVNAQIASGTAAAASVYQAKATLANAQVTLLTDQAGVVTASAQLKNDIGVDSTENVNPVPLAKDDELPPPPPAETPKSLADYLAIAYANRQDLKAQKAEVERQNELVKEAEINAGPEITGTVGEQYENEPANLFAESGWDTRAMLTASWLVFDGGYNRGAIKIAQASRDAARDTLVEDQNNVHLAVEQDLATRTQALNSAALAETALQAAQVNYDSSVAEQREGLLTVVDVITAEATLAQAQQNYVSTIYNFYIADANLQRAIGTNDVTPVVSPTPATGPATNPAAAAGTPTIVPAPRMPAPDTGNNTTPTVAMPNTPLSNPMSTPPGPSPSTPSPPAPAPSPPSTPSTAPAP